MGIKIGTAGWSIPKQVADRFPPDGSSLERYATQFRAAEINSSFHRPHRPSTWERWRDSVAEDFRFSAKLPKTITHLRKLVDCAEELTHFLEQVHLLGDKLQVLLVQLPPKLEFEPAAAAEFFSDLRSKTPAEVACEPRNASWFTASADRLLADWRVARVAADPALCAAAGVPGGWHGLEYWRLHGSPVIYRSSYSDRIDQLASAIRTAGTGASPAWCIFDNTASSAATADALALAAALQGPRRPPKSLP